MTLASKITLGRLFCAPVFAVLAVMYGETVKSGQPNETIRWWAVGIFIAAAISDGIDGYIYEQGNIDELADLLEQLASDPNLRGSVGRHARKTVMARFSVRRMVSDYQQLLS